jgi:hypothetical protein
VKLRVVIDKLAWYPQEFCGSHRKTFNSIASRFFPSETEIRKKRGFSIIRVEAHYSS